VNITTKEALALVSIGDSEFQRYIVKLMEENIRLEEEVKKLKALFPEDVKF